jgi:MATE family multidrug resistance protein
MIKNPFKREILAIAIPAIISNITTPILGLIDTAIVGHIGSASYIGAIAVGGNMLNMLYWLFAFLRMGASGLTAQAIGANDTKQVSVILYRSMLIALLASCIMILLSVPIADLVLKFMNADYETAMLAKRYFSICIFGAPVVLGMYALSGWFIGLQNSRMPMWLAILSNVVNIIVSLVLVLGFNMRIEGVALGTLVAQWVSFIVGLYIVKHTNIVSLNVLGFKEIFDKVALKKFFRINTDIFLRTLCLVFVTLWFTHAGAEQGVEILAANSILMQFFMLFSFFMDGFAYAGEALVGKYYGMGSKVCMRATVKDLLLIGFIMAIVGCCIYYVCNGFIINMLTNDNLVLNTIDSYIYWAIFIPLFGFLAFVYDGIFIGLTLSRQMLYSMLISMIVFFVVYLSLSSVFANHALWLAFSMYLISRGVVQMAIFQRIRYIS